VFIIGHLGVVFGHLVAALVPHRGSFSRQSLPSQNACTSTSITLFIMLYLKQKCAMRTTVDLPDGLLEKAMKISGAKTKSHLVTEVLKDMIKRHERLKLLTFKGKIDLDIDLDNLRERK